MIFFSQTDQIFGQEIVNEAVREEVQQTAQQTAQDSTLPVAGGTIATTAAAALGLYLNDRKDKKKLETKIQTVEEESQIRKKQIDEIVLNLEIVCFKIFYAAYIYEEKSMKQILDLKATNNPLEKSTLGEEYANQINKLSQLVQINYNIPMPNMSVASPQVIASSSVLKENRSTTPSMQPPPMTQHKTTDNTASSPPTSTDPNKPTG